jgi:hypothetical protein
VKPGVNINISGLDLMAFNKFENDINLEYGDVINNLVVSTHDRTFLKINDIPWWRVEFEYLKVLTEKVNYLTPSITPTQLSQYKPSDSIEIKPDQSDSLDQILLKIISLNASTISLTKFEHFFWSMDLKRILPKIYINAELHRIEDVFIVTHLRKYFNSITSPNPIILIEIHKQIKFLELNERF